MHTLPYAAVPQTLAWSPSINTVAVCGATGGIGLYRSSGQLVWSVPGKRGAVARRALWKPDGTKLAVVYEDGSVQLLSAATGRTDDVKCNVEDASAICWPLSRVPKDGQDPMIPGPEAVLLPLTVGLKSGQLSLSLFGLDLPRMQAIDEPIEHICVNDDQTRYAIAGKTKVAVIDSSYLSDYGKILSLVCEQPAQLAAMLSTLCAGVQTFESLYKSMLALDKRFIGSLAPSNSPETSSDILYEFLQDPQCEYKNTVDEWMNSEHENGFKRWHKGVASKVDEMRTLFRNNLLKIPLQLVSMLGDMAGAASVCGTRLPEGLTPSDIDELAIAARKIALHHYELFEWLNSGAVCFVALVGTLQRKFTDAISRSVVVVPADGFKARDALVYLQKYYQASNPVDTSLAGELKNTFETVHAHCRRLVSATFRVTQTYTMSVVGLHFHNNDIYAMTSDMHLGKLGQPGTKVSGSAASFDNDRVAVTDGLALSIYTLDGVLAKEESVDYEAGAVAMRGSNICALSHDMHHIDMFTV